MSKIIDTHTHIYDEQFQEDFNDVMKNIEEQMEGIVSIGFDMGKFIEKHRTRK